MLKLILFEDEHLLVVNKPAGLNTHAPSPWAGEGLYDWLRHREPRWASLALLHRLDKETSGVMVFGKTPDANRSLTGQFTRGEVRKRYLLLTDRPAHASEFTVTSALVRAGERYLSRPVHAGSQPATTRFRVEHIDGPRTLLAAEPLTGRTHQIRVHAAAQGLPILGDVLYGGSPAPRLCLHAASLAFKHPADGRELRFESGADFHQDTRLSLRQALIDPTGTEAFRVVHGASDGWPGWYVDRLGDYFLSQSEPPLGDAQRVHLETLPKAIGAGLGTYHKRLDRQVRRSLAAEASPQHVLGAAAPDRFPILENGLSFELSFREGYSTGLFLDQRDNRRRLLTGHVAARFPLFPEDIPGRQLLNTFAYTCAFSVCAARAGLRTTSLDLSKKYLEWGRTNFVRNGLDPAGHDFIYGDVFDWLGRLGKKQRRFDAIVLDPPTFSQSKEHGVFRAEKDYPRLVLAALPLLKPEGVLLASTNVARFGPEEFLEAVQGAIRSGGRKVLQQHYAPQPPDFPVSRAEPAYLKTVWLRVG
jgi:23S rRNA (cytosine1962-C5)-methyltransferase